MITVEIRCESRYKVNRERIKSTIERVLTEKGVTGDAEVSVLICGERKMRELHRKYMKFNDQDTSPNDELHDVLSFPLEGVNYPDNVLRLGDMVICYPVAIREAAEKNMLVDDEIDFLVGHSCLHLLGIHHE